MRAIVYDTYGDESVLTLRELPAPVPGPGEVLVSVAATSVNPADWRLRSGQFRLALRITMPFVPGVDVAGRVAAVGPEVHDLAPGDAVMACLPTRQGGGAAELVAVKREHLARYPASLAPTEAAALPLCGLTALQALDLMPPPDGKDLLVIGAAGGVGSLALQIATARGARVTAYVRNDAVQLMRDLGAHDVVTREQVALEDPALRSRFDLVLDAANALPLSRTSRLLRPNGTAVTVNPFSGRLHPRFLAPLRGGRILSSVYARPDGDGLVELAHLVEQGSVCPVIDQVLALEDLAQAHRAVADGGRLGKTVIAVQ